MSQNPKAHDNAKFACIFYFIIIAYIVGDVIGLW